MNRTDDGLVVDLNRKADSWTELVVSMRQYRLLHLLQVAPAKEALPKTLKFDLNLAPIYYLSDSSHLVTIPCNVMLYLVIGYILVFVRWYNH